VADSSKRRGFRFSVRTTLIAITLAALASWLYWDGWTRYCLYRERIQFEEFLKQLDGNIETVADLIPEERDPYVMGDDDGGYIACELPTCTFFLYFPKEALASPHVMKIYRLANAPESYASKTYRPYIITNGTTERMLVQIPYWDDFKDLISGEYLSNDPPHDPEIKYELIHTVSATARHE
jgi:hypothetical protein